MSRLPSPRKSRRPHPASLSVALLAILRLYTRWRMIQHDESLGVACILDYSLGIDKKVNRGYTYLSILKEIHDEIPSEIHYERHSELIMIP